MSNKSFKSYLRCYREIFEANAYNGALELANVLDYDIVNMSSSHHHKVGDKCIVLSYYGDPVGIIIKKFDNYVYSVYDGYEFMWKPLFARGSRLKGSLTDIVDYIKNI